MAVAFLNTGWAADPPAGPGNSAPVVASAELATLKAQIEEQQKQIEQLRTALEAQGKVLERFSAASPEPQHRMPAIGEVASSTPMLPPAPAAAPTAPRPLPSPQAGEAPGPLSIHIGDAYITPVGFMDFTNVFRTTTVGSGIGTNFGSIPFNNVPAGKLTEQRLSTQNSRIGFRVDTSVKGVKVLAYMESDLLGTPPGNVAVSSNSDAMRLRLYWVDLKKDKWEVLGGQTWSLMTPGRNGISALPGDLFYSQDIDTNYQLGLTWGRIPEFRFVYHPTSTVAWAIAASSPEQYIGGSAGGGTVVLPSAFTSSYANQLDSGGTTLNAPNVIPDIITKLAFDPKVGPLHQHIEVGGIMRAFRVYNPLASQHYSAIGGGGFVNFNLELAKNFHAIANTFFSDGGGRYIFGQGPDLIIRADGSPSLVHAYSTAAGFEATPAANTLLYAYYGGAYFGRNTAIDPATGKLVGYGYTGSSNGQNRNIQEGTFGVTQTLWKSPNYGSLIFMAQYSYLNRDPWYAGTGPKDAHTNLVFLNLRYALPGSAPSIK
jgi:hypothetical protein